MGKFWGENQNGEISYQAKYDTLKWTLFFILLIAGIVANAYFGQVAWAIRAAIGIVLALVLVGLASSTAKGQEAWTFIKASRTELRKVVWPTRQETAHTSIVVVGAVVVSSLILWGIDTIFIWLVSMSTR